MVFALYQLTPHLQQRGDGLFLVDTPEVVLWGL